mmetsp:Transcript_5782/g.13280  ORF Transcript_5782/g.13280 Transcript_5782/m.13280 type:complete len:210 (-) Transcript_5782:603-1232(-)
MAMMRSTPVTPSRWSSTARAPVLVPGYSSPVYFTSCHRCRVPGALSSPSSRSIMQFPKSPWPVQITSCCTGGFSCWPWQSQFNSMLFMQSILTAYFEMPLGCVSSPHQSTTHWPPGEESLATKILVGPFIGSLARELIHMLNEAKSSPLCGSRCIVSVAVQNVSSIPVAFSPKRSDGSHLSGRSSFCTGRSGVPLCVIGGSFVPEVFSF